MKTQLDIHDFELFHATVQNMTKVSDSARITFTPHGFHASVKASVMGKEKVGRVDIDSTSVSLPDDSDDVTIATKELAVISQLLGKIVKAHTPKSKKANAAPPDYSDVVIVLDDMSVNLKSSAFKTKLNLVEPKVVPGIAPFDHRLTKIADVNVNVDDVNEILSSKFIFKSPDGLSVEIAHQDDMLKNFAYAILSDPTDPHSNSVVSKLGNIMSGDLTRQIFLDMSRLQLLATFQVESLKLEFNNEPCAVTEFTDNGSGNGFRTNYKVIFKYLAAPMVDARAGQLV